MKASDLNSIRSAMKNGSYHDNERLLSVAALKRLVKLGGGRRFGRDLAEKHDVYDKYGVVHNIFKESFDELAEKALFVTINERKKTLLPRHVQQVGRILGTNKIEDKTLRVIAIAPLKRRLRRMVRGKVRINDDALKTLASLAVNHTVNWIRSSAGLAAHENDRQTISKRDILNAEKICRNFPR